MPKFIGKITRDDASDFKLIPAEDIDIRGANDLSNITLSDDDYIIIDDISMFPGIDSGTENSTGKITVAQLKAHINNYGIANDNGVQIDAADVAEDDYAQFTADGVKGTSASELLTDIGALSTSGGGMTGDITMSNGIIQWINTTDTSNGPKLSLSKERASTAPVIDDSCGSIAFAGEDSAGNSQNYAVINSKSKNVTSTTEKGEIALSVAQNGNLYNVITGTGGTNTGDVEISLGDSSTSTVSFNGDTLSFKQNPTILALQAGHALRITDGGSTYTPTHELEVVTKHYCDGNNNQFTFQAGGKMYTRYDNWYFPDTQYGYSGNLWRSSYNSSTMMSTWRADYHPLFVAPADITINEVRVYGNPTSTETFEFAMSYGTPSWGTTAHTSMTQIGTTLSGNLTNGQPSELADTGLSVSVSKGDVIVPQWRRTTTDTSTFLYFEGLFMIIGVYA